MLCWNFPEAEVYRDGFLEQRPPSKPHQPPASADGDELLRRTIVRTRMVICRSDDDDCSSSTNVDLQHGGNGEF